MAFNLPKYSITYADAQDRVNVIYLDPDGYGTASVTAITPAGSPLAYEFGSNNDDEYRALNPTGLLIRVKVGDTTLFDEISGDVSLSWRVRWERSSTEVWRGYLITDEIDQPFNQPSILTLRAVCGIKELDGVKWTASAGVDSFVDHASDILSNLTGQVTAIGYASNWHSYNGGTAVTGNTFDRYEYNSAALSNPLDATELPVASLALEQTVGRFGAKICLANGKWRIFQRSLLGASYSMSTYGGGSETISAFSIANSDIYSDATGSNAPAYYKTEIGYYHYPEETGFILNGDFDNWTGSVPDNWTEVGGGGNLTKVPYNVSSVPRLIPINDGYVCQIVDVAHSGTDYGSDAVSNATIGIYQDSAFDVRATSHKISLSFSSRHIGNANANLLFFYSIWLDGDLGTDYFWDAPNKTWQSTGGGTIGTPTSGSKMGRIASDTWADFSVEATAVPDTGTIRIYLWNIVDKGGNTAGIWFKNVRVGYLTGDRSERVKTTTVATNDTRTSGLVRPESFFFMGQGPSINHTGAITFGGGATLAENWKTSDYATSEASSGETLEKVHAEEILDARGNATPRIRLTFRPSSGSYWPHMPLSYNSNVYSCVMLSYDSRLDEYQGEWLKVGSSAVTITTEEKYSDEDVRPTDFDTNIFTYTSRPTIGVTGFGSFELGSSNNLFPRVNGSGSDASGALGSNYFTGDLEISTGATISFKGGTLTRAVTGGDLTWNSDGLAFTYDRADSVTVPSILNLTWDNENGTDTVNLGFTATDKGGGVWTTDDWHVSSAVPILIKTTAGNYDITLTPNGTGSVILDGLSYPQADGTAGQILYTNGSGVLAFTTDAPTDGQYLRWNTGGSLTWETIAGGVTAINDLSDVTITTAITGDLLRYNGTVWVNYADSNYATASALSAHTGDSSIHYTQASITTVGTISTGVWQGTAIGDSYISSASSWNTAYGWGNHATQGYLTSVPAFATLISAATDTSGTPTDKHLLYYDGGGPGWVSTHLSDVIADSGAVSANTAKVTNATHTGEVTGSGALTVDVTAITNRTALSSGLASTDEFLVNDGGTLKKVASSVIYSYMDSVMTDHNKCLVSNISDVSVGNTGTETTLFAGTVRGSKNISANTVQTGTVISVTARGYLITKVIGGGSDAIDMRFKIGGVTVLDTGAFSLGFDIATGWWEFMGDITVDTSGATGNVWAQGIFRWYDDNAGTYSDTHVVNNAVSSSINFTSSATMDFTATWTAGDAGNIITCTTLFVDLRNRA